jgi:tetratricopeptide (TPR) repeat protein
VEVPPELEALIMKALSKNPADRFANAEEMREALLACVGGDVSAPARAATAPKLAPHAKPAPTPQAKAAPTASQAKTVTVDEEPPRRPGGGRVAIAIAAVVLVAGGGAAAFLLGKRSGDASATAAPVAQPPVVPPAPQPPAVAQPEPQPQTAQEPQPALDPAPAKPDAEPPPPDRRDRRQARLDPARARDYLKQADALRAQLDCNGAIPLYLAAEAADPELAEVQKKLAICYQSVGDTKKAVRRYKRYLATEPEDAEKVKLILSTLR